MAKYAITFRIDYAERAGSTYGERYSSFMEQVRKTGVWEETTSFALTTSAETTEQLCDRLYFQSKFTAAYDTVVVVNIDTGFAVSRGVIKSPATLRAKVNGLLQK
ncbi:hypothetical protein [Citromicrobium bathyomarinum]|uniref:hypothetical protein n=1 Tax=Citromicrobium bathyomarinum TaxID=72174 RepID=UPI003159BA03